MMTVVIDDTKPAVPEQVLLTARHALKARDCFSDVRSGKPKLVQQSDDGAGVGEVFLAQQLDAEFAQALSCMPNFEESGGSRMGRRCGVRAGIGFHAILRQRMKTIG